MEVFQKVQEVLKNPDHFVRGQKSKNGQRVIGIFLPDVPEELIDASGFYPFNILNPGKSSAPDGVIPGFACSLMTHTFNQASLGELEFLDGMVIPYLCDSSRALFHLWEKGFQSNSQT